MKSTLTILLLSLLLLPGKAYALYSELHSLIVKEASEIRDVPPEISLFAGDNSDLLEGHNGTLYEGAYDEDADRDPRLTSGVGAWWGLLNWGTHFWDPQYGPDGGLLTRVEGWPVNLESQNAYQRAAGLYDEAVALYAQDPASAYYILGRVAHLLGDMATPAHVHLDPHVSDLTTSGDDSFEEFTGARYVGPGPAAGRGVFESDFPLSGLIPVDYGDLADGGYPAEPPLFRLFYSMATLSSAFDSDDADGSVDSGMRRGVSIPLRRNDLTAVVALCQGQEHPVTKGYGASPERNKFILLDSLVQELSSESPSCDRIRLVFPDSSEVHYLDEFMKTDMDDGDAAAIALQVLPEALRHSAALYQMFWSDTHQALASGAPLLVINDGDYLSEIRKPEPVEVRVDISPAGWDGAVVEIYAWAEVFSPGSSAMFYFDGSSWSAFREPTEMKPALPSFALGEVKNFVWRIFDDSSGLPAGKAAIRICIDRLPDGSYTPSQSVCSSAAADIKD